MGAPQAAPSAPLPGRPTPLREATRRFLRPLLGVDPASVAVHRDPSAGRLAEALQADALAVGDAVVLPPTADETRPETLGLLAHELAHVARRREPRFVPPLLRRDAPSPAVQADEERLAGQVEADVARAARAQEPPPARGAAPLPDWGGLPAPWEPLPGAFAPRPAAPPRPPGRPGGEAAPRPAPADPPGRPGGEAAPRPAPAGPPPPPVQRAPEDRPLAPAQPPASAPSPDPPAPELDLDELARQVYAVLKQRLAVERRRMR